MTEPQRECLELTRVFALGEDILSLRLASKLAELRFGYADRICAFGTEPAPKYRVAAQDNPTKKNSHKRLAGARKYKIILFLILYRT